METKRGRARLSWRWLTLALLIAATLPGCGRTLYPVTSGSYRTLPQDGVKLVVWGPDPASRLAVTTWLRDRGLHVWDPSIVERMTGDLHADRTGDWEPAFDTADALHADGLVLIEAPGVSSFPASMRIRGFGPVRQVQWEAAAWYPDTRLNLADVVPALACQALATVWGFRPAGYHEIDSAAMCALVKSRPFAHPTPSHEPG